jgi:hypothetical protein
MSESHYPQRQPYHAPELRVHGSVEQLTQTDPVATSGDDGIYGTAPVGGGGGSH